MFGQFSEKNTGMSYFMKICTSCFTRAGGRADGQADRLEEANTGFSLLTCLKQKKKINRFALLFIRLTLCICINIRI
jgi:hypothetical protein